MSLESTMICLDTSDYMRNGDYPPIRIEAQHDAASVLLGAKLNLNRESTVGLLTYGAGQTRLLCSPTDDQGKLLAALHGLTPRGTGNFISAVKTAYLALKHRKIGHGGQRIVAFVGSPIAATEQQLKELGAALAKNNVTADVIACGENEGNVDKLNVFIAAVNKKDGGQDTCRLLAVPAGVMPAQMLMESPIYAGDMGGGGGGGGGAGGAAGGFPGVDAAMDPELAHALRISAEEARAAEAAAAGPGAGTSGSAGVPSAGAGGGGGMLDEDELLQQALLLSMAEAEAAAAATSGSGGAAPPATPAAPAPASAPAAAAPSAATGASGDAFTTPMPSTAPAATPGAPVAAAAPGTAAPGSAAASTPADAGFVDPSFALSLLSDLPGVNVDDPAIQEMLRSLQAPGGGAGGAGGSGSGGSGSGGSGADPSKK